MADEKPDFQAQAWLQGGGEMGQRIRSYDWAQTELGEPARWPQSLKALTGLMLASAQPMWVAWGPSLIWLSNDAFIPILGSKHPHALGRPALLEVWSEARDVLAPMFARVLSGDPIHMQDFALELNRNGRLEEAHFAFSYTPARDESGAVAGIFCACIETTAQVVMGRQQAAAHERQKRIYEQSPSFVCTMEGPKHVFEFVNKAHRTLFNSGEWLGKPAREAFPDLAGQGYFEHLDAVYKTGQRFVATSAPVRYRLSPDSPEEERLLDFIYAPIVDDAGTITGIFCEGFDVTERRRAEGTLARVTADSERLRRLYETVLSATPDFVYVFSLDHRVLYANDSLIRMWGRGREGAIGKTFLEIGYEPWHAEMHSREIDEVRATKQPLRGEVPFTGTNGRRIYDYIFSPVIGADGEVEAVAGVTRDVTDRKEAELELSEADRKKDEFIALLAHELRNPLAPLRNGLQLVRHTQDATIREQAHAMMDRQFAHLVRLIDDLLDVSRIGRNKMELRRARVTLAAVVESAIEVAQTAIDAAGHELIVTLPDRPVYLDADLTRLAQVLSNLLTNSAKYTERGGTIWLSAKRIDDTIEVTVKDTGIGIPPESLPRIFDMFSQVDRSIERETGGLGIGLALVKGLTEMHGGTVVATSDGEGRGSTFTITLPAIADVADIRVEPSVRDRSAVPARRVLVVDDNHDGAKSLSMMLELAGHEVALAHDGIEAIERAAQFRPDVILMDIGMPRLNGLDATRRIRQEPWGQAPAIIALTGWGQECDREQSREAGCTGHLTKPVALDDLNQVFRTL